MASNLVVSYIIRAKDNFSGVSAKVVQSMKDMDKNAKEFTMKLSAMGKGLGNIGKTLSMKLTAPIVGLGALSVNAAAQVERLGVSFTVMSGSAEKSKKIMGDLLNIAKKAPFVFKDIGQSAKVLFSTGKFDQNTLGAEVKKIGDIAAVYDIDLESLSSVYSSVINQNKLMGGEIQQLQNYGIPVIEMLKQIIKEKKGVTYSSKKILQFAGEGQISANALRMIFDKMTEKGGTAFEGMAKATDTLSGSFTKFKDVMFLTAANFGDVIAKTLNLKENVKGLEEKLHHASERFKIFSETNPAVTGLIVKLGLLLAALGPIALVLSGIVKTIAVLRVATLALMGPWGLVAAAILAAVAAVDKLKSSFGELKQKGLTNKEAAAGAVPKLFGGYKGQTLFTGLPMIDQLLTAINGYTNYQVEKNANSQLQGIDAKKTAALNASATVDININDKNKNVKSTNVTQSGWMDTFNLGVNNISSWLRG